jgi:hypothetical protein
MDTLLLPRLALSPGTLPNFLGFGAASYNPVNKDDFTYKLGNLESKAVNEA